MARYFKILRILKCIPVIDKISMNVEWIYKWYHKANPAYIHTYIYISLTSEACTCRHCRKRILYITRMCLYTRVCTSTATTQRFDLPPVSIVANAATRQQEAILIPAQSLLRPRLHRELLSHLRHGLVVS